MKKLIKTIIKEVLPVILEIVKTHFSKQPVETKECKPAILKPKRRYCKPLKRWGKCVSQGHGAPSSVYKLTGHHQGVDHAVPLGTEIYAPADGEIVETGYHAKGLGNFVVCKYAPDRWLVAAHLKEKMPTGIVKRGDTIGVVGDTGFIMGVHSHIEIWCFNPVPRLNLPGDFKDNWRKYTLDPLSEFA